MFAGLEMLCRLMLPLEAVPSFVLIILSDLNIGKSADVLPGYERNGLLVLRIFTIEA